MFDIGFFELLLLAVVALLIMGPERLPETVMETGRLLFRLKKQALSLYNEFEQQFNKEKEKVKQDLAIRLEPTDEQETKQHSKE